MRRLIAMILALAVGGMVTACAGRVPAGAEPARRPMIRAETLSRPAPRALRRVETVTSGTCGEASWYGGKWAGKPTASGEIYDPSTMTAAHRTLKFGTRVRVTDQRTGRAVTVRINNRGPFIKGRIIDLSVRAAEQLGFRARGVTQVCLAVVG